jgi:hypothetical protein
LPGGGDGPSEQRGPGASSTTRTTRPATALPGAASPDQVPFSRDPNAIEHRLRETVRYLASDELEGRGVGTRGLDLAAEYIARQFSDAGLNVDRYGGTPYQQFFISSRLALGSPNRAELKGPAGKRVPLKLAEDFTTRH